MRGRRDIFSLSSSKAGRIKLVAHEEIKLEELQEMVDQKLKILEAVRNENDMFRFYLDHYLDFHDFAALVFHQMKPTQSSLRRIRSSKPTGTEARILLTKEEKCQVIEAEIAHVKDLIRRLRKESKIPLTEYSALAETLRVALEELPIQRSGFRRRVVRTMFRGALPSADAYIYNHQQSLKFMDQAVNRILYDSSVLRRKVKELKAQRIRNRDELPAFGHLEAERLLVFNSALLRKFRSATLEAKRNKAYLSRITRAFLQRKELTDFMIEKKKLQEMVDNDHRLTAHGYITALFEDIQATDKNQRLSGRNLAKICLQKYKGVEPSFDSKKATQRDDEDL
ncbi:unnamed protein product [Calicophoron daubneyi]|uniref:Uncharacterized protein n=1 Tax=Calicophoron daubneyi TaxID=300641 RepID=A0AAV2TAD1_CALDB